MSEARLRALFVWNFGTLLACFGETNRDGLLATLHGSSFAPFAGAKRSLLLPADRAFHALARGFAVLAAAGFLAALGGHSIPSGLDLLKLTGIRLLAPT